jgi:peptidoglycan biosynthesis protein MviN/MurJ (putative lipid II flippase)
VYLKNKIEPLIVTIANIVARGSHLLFFLVIGNKYGASGTTDIVLYLLAPLTVLTAVASGAAESVIMPAFHKTDNIDTARYLFVYAVKKITIFILPLSLLIILIFSAINKHFDFWMIAILLPTPLFGSLAAFKIGVLNASNKFRLAVLGPLFGGIAAVSFLVLAPVNMYCFGLSFLLFELCKAGGLYFFKDLTQGGRPLQSDAGDKIIRCGVKNTKLQVISSLILALVYPVDIWFAGTLETGSITFVEYANRLWNIVPLLFVGHIAITYASLSKAASGKVSNNALNIHRIAVRYLFLGIGLSLTVILTSHSISRLLFGFGEMSIQQQDILADLLNSYLLGAGMYVGGLVYVRAMSAMGRVDLLLAVACLGLLCNIICDAVFVRLIGVNGIGLATSVVYTCNFFALAYLYEKNY